MSSGVLEHAVEEAGSETAALVGEVDGELGYVDVGCC